MNMEFDEIRPYHDEELPQIYEELIADPAFQQVASAVFPEVPFEALAQKMRACKTKLEFQKAFCYVILRKFSRDTTQGVTLDHTAQPEHESAYTYISNHRDIILDSGFLSVELIDKGMDTVEIAIGDNLLIYPWIKKFVRVNKSFIVQRTLTCARCWNPLDVCHAICITPLRIRINPSGLPSVKDVPKTPMTVPRKVCSKCLPWAEKAILLIV